MQKQMIVAALALSVVGLIACGSDSKKTTTTACTPATEADFASPTYNPNACSQMMFAKYGDAGFQAVNGAIGKLAFAAPTSELGSSFQTKLVAATPERQSEFGAHLLQFLEAAYGNTAAPYTGPGMVPAHAGLDITRAQYDYFLTDVVVPALKSVITDPNNQADIGNCFAPVLMDPNVIKTVVTCH